MSLINGDATSALPRNREILPTGFSQEPSMVMMQLSSLSGKVDTFMSTTKIGDALRRLNARLDLLMSSKPIVPPFKEHNDGYTGCL